MIRNSHFFLLLLMMNWWNVYAEKILFVTGQFPSITETFILNQIVELIGRGHEVYICANGKGNMSKIHSDVKKYNLLSKTFYKTVPRHLAPFDIVYCQFGNLAFKAVRQYKDLARAIFICFRGTDITTFAKRRPLFYKRLFLYAQRHSLDNVKYLPVCNYFRRLLMALGCPEQKIVIQSSAIDCDDIIYQKKKYKFSDPIKILSVGRLVEKKGREDLLRAFSMVIKRFPFAHLTIVGDGPQGKKLRKLIGTLKLQDHVTLYGWATKQEVKKLLSEHHIFVLSSKRARDGNQEGIPNALKEAMAAGLPVVSTRHSGISELIEHEKTGLLVYQGDYLALAQCIIQLIRSPETWEDMTRRARKFVESNYHLPRVIDKLEKLIKEIR